MSFPSGAIWNCRSGFGICLRHTTTVRATGLRGGMDAISTFPNGPRPPKVHELPTHPISTVRARCDRREGADPAVRRAGPPIQRLETRSVRADAHRAGRALELQPTCRRVASRSEGRPGTPDRRGRGLRVTLFVLHRSGHCDGALVYERARRGRPTPTAWDGGGPVLQPLSSFSRFTF